MNNNKYYLKYFRRKMNIEGDTIADQQRNELERNFDELLENMEVATVFEVPFIKNNMVGLDQEKQKIRVNVEDTATNDQKTNDEKYFSFSRKSNVGIGDMIYWHDLWWIMYHQERHATDSFTLFTAKKCNHLYKVDVRGLHLEFPCLITNLTLYSDGMADKVYMSNQDGKRRMTITDNYFSSFLSDESVRIMINGKTFEVTHIDDFSRPGVKDCILSQVFLSDKDDRENNLAYNESFKDTSHNIIIGSDYSYIGSKEIYGMYSNDTVVWRIIAEDDCAYSDNKYEFNSNKDDINRGCRIIVKNDLNNVGKKIKIQATVYNEVVAEKEVIVKGLF